MPNNTATLPPIKQNRPSLSLPTSAYSQPAASDKPHVIQLEGLLGAGVSLLAPLPVTVEYVEDLFVVYDDLFGVYGDGDTEAEAVADYKLSLIDFYQLSVAHAAAREIDRQALAQIQQYLTHEVL
jgi:hypothetical protein